VLPVKTGGRWRPECERGAIPSPTRPARPALRLSVGPRRARPPRRHDHPPRLAAIAHRHRSYGLEPPNGNEAVRQVLRASVANSAWRPSGRRRRPTIWSAALWPCPGSRRDFIDRARHPL